MSEGKSFKERKQDAILDLTSKRTALHIKSLKEGFPFNVMTMIQISTIEVHIKQIAAIREQDFNKAKGEGI